MSRHRVQENHPRAIDSQGPNRLDAALTRKVGDATRLGARVPPESVICEIDCDFQVNSDRLEWPETGSARVRAGVTTPKIGMVVVRGQVPPITWRDLIIILH